MVTFSKEELNYIASQTLPYLLEMARSSSLEIDDVDIIDDYSGITSMPAYDNGGGLKRIVRVPLSVLAKPAEDAANNLKDAADHPTYIGEDYYVYKWNNDTKVYEKTDIYVRGEAFKVNVVWASEAEMKADTKTYDEGTYGMISTGDVEQQENGVVYVYKNGVWEFFVDMSGKRGADGKTAQFKIGTVVKGNEASASLVENGEDENGNPIYLINLVLPKGDKGEQGIQGDILTWDKMTDTEKDEVISGVSESIGSDIKGALDDVEAATNEAIEATEGLDAIVEEQNTKLTELGLEISYVAGFVEYGFINPRDGKISNPDEPDVNHNQFVNTGYLRIDRSRKIVFRADTANKYNLALAYYNSDKTFISGISNITTDDAEIITIESENIPSNTKYIVVSKKVNSNNAFVAFTPDYSISHDFIIDTPKGKNLYNKFYSDYILTDKIIDSNHYILHGVKRDKNESHITISYNTEGSWDCIINFYDTNFNFLSSVKGSANNTFIIPNDTEYIIFKTFGHNILYDHNFMINYGEEVLPFEDFNSSIGQYVQLKDLKQNIQSISAIHSYQFGLIGYINNKGEVIAENEGNSDFRSTSLLHIAKDSEIYFKGDSTNEYVNVIAFYDINKKFINGLSKIDEKEKTIHKFNYSELPEGTKYIRVCRRKNDTTAFVSYSQFEQTHFDYIIDIPKGNNLYNINNKYTEINNSTVYQIPTAILRDNNQDKIILSNRISVYYLLVYFYDADYTLISKVNNLQVGNVINIPKTCKYITFLDYGDSLKKGGTMVNYGEKLLPYEEYNTILAKEDKKTKINNRSFSAKLDSLTNGSLSIDVPNVKYNQTIGFFAKVNNFGKITLSHGKQNYAACMVDIDSTNIITYTTAPQVAGTYPHGLNINTYIEVLISQTDTTTAMLYIRTLGGEFSKEIPFNGSRDNVLCEAENCDLRNCLLTHTSSDYKKEIWAFGDSYFDYIPLRLKEIKHNNALFDAFSGRNSSDALKSLKKMVGVVGTPKIIYWALGMNDRDSDSSVNSSWNNVFNELKTICENYSIELILATIPNVSTVNNRFKNEIVRNSGYRYVDNSMYVGADISDDWYDGLIGSDKIHPSNNGAKVLANGLAISIPELKI